jgi:hypothetical protein
LEPACCVIASSRPQQAPGAAKLLQVMTSKQRWPYQPCCLSSSASFHGLGALKVVPAST